MRTAVVVGTGLLGSSFGLAAQQSKLFDRVIGVSSEAVVQKALEVGAIHEALSLEQALPQADFVILCQPVRRILSSIEKLDPLLRIGTLVTDVGSTKADICIAAEKHIRRARFVGGHPMAGREVRGPEGARADLFEGRRWVLTAADQELLAVIEAVGAKPVLLDPVQHDQLVALSSHLPQLLSTALGSFLEGKSIGQVAGPGLMDMTRLAQSSFELWEDILVTNAGNVDAALTGIIAEIEALRASLQAGNAASYFERAANTARALRS